MAPLDAREIPADTTSQERLRQLGLDYRLIDADPASADAFLRAETRGFLDPEPNDELLDFDRPTIAMRRNVGVFDADADPSALPVATANSWVTPLTVPGGEVDMWAISAVTVSGTHRRRGIARALLEGELRAAASAGVPIAGLTASEATLYERYGFAVAIPVSRLRVTTRRAGWAGAELAGRIEYLERPRLAAALGAMHERARTQCAGQIAGWSARWERMAGLAPNDAKGTSVRGVGYVDEQGQTRGAMAYTLSESTEPGIRYEMSIRQLAAETPDALRALWRFAVQHDLVDLVTADLRPVDDPLPWLVADQRSVEQTVHDHGWLRILDVPAVLAARTYAADVDLVVAVSDPLDIASGAWRVRTTAGGRATVDPSEQTPDITLGIADLSATFLGGVTLTRLSDAGRLRGDAAALAAFDRALRAERMPHLSIWY